MITTTLLALAGLLSIAVIVGASLYALSIIFGAKK